MFGGADFESAAQQIALGLHTVREHIEDQDERLDFCTEFANGLLDRLTREAAGLSLHPSQIEDLVGALMNEAFDIVARLPETGGAKQ